MPDSLFPTNHRSRFQKLTCLSLIAIGLCYGPFGSQSSAADDFLNAGGLTSNPEWRVDVDPGTAGVQRCRRVPVQGALTCPGGGAPADFSVDVILANVPTTHWLHYVQFVLAYDPAYVTVVCVDINPAFTLYAGTCIPGPGQIGVRGGILGCGGPNGDVRIATIYFNGIGTAGVYGQSGFDIVPGTGCSDITGCGGTCAYDVFPPTCGAGDILSTSLANGHGLVVLDDPNNALPLSCINVNSTGNQSERMPGSANPVIGGVAPGIGTVTLRSAIQVANGYGGANRITFRIPDAGMGGGPPWTIGVSTTALPALMDASGGTMVDGRTQSGVEVAPLFLVVDNPGFTITSANNSILSLAIRNFVGAAGSGVLISGANARNNVIKSCKIGTGGANGIGVQINGAPTNTIGGMIVADENVISGNAGDGVLITGTGASGNRVIGNTIGLADDTMTPLPNGGAGVEINNAPNNAVGLDTGPPGQPPGNYISANTGDGVLIRAAGATGNQVKGNVIGLDVNGVAAPNSDGVEIRDALNNTVGGLVDNSRNVISGNSANGVFINRTASPTTGNSVRGNYIGLDLLGLLVRPNMANGVTLNNAANNTVGGSAGSPGAPPGNFISGNMRDGVFITAAASGNLVQGNVIGLNKAGAITPNTKDGVGIDGASSNTIGGSTTGVRNVISGNDENGVLIEATVGTAETNVVQGNYIGLNLGGNLARPNGDDGVEIKNVPKNIVGGATATPGVPPGNYISGNTADGVYINLSGAFSNSVSGNVIGLDTAGNTLGNDGEGAHIVNALRNQVGAVGAINVLSANGGRGVLISGVSSVSNLVYANRIGTSTAGNATRPNLREGVRLDLGAKENRIGGSGLGEGNLISGNTLENVLIGGPITSSNRIEQNIVGLSFDSTVALGGIKGVFVNNSHANRILGNTIAGHSKEGIHLIASGDSEISGNTIGHPTLALFNNSHGVYLECTATGGCTNNVIWGNSIVNNHGDGVRILGGSVVGPIAPALVNAIYGNAIRFNLGNVSATGGSIGSGVTLLGLTLDTVIGGFIPQAANEISSNEGNGVAVLTNIVLGIVDFPANTLIVGNAIGIHSNTAAPNGLLLLPRSGVLLMASNSVVGTNNIISGNTLHGVEISGPYAASNRVVGNLIGLAPDGNTPVGNSGAGVSISNAPNNTVGGPALVDRNIISGNLSNGVQVIGNAAPAAVIRGNFIGTDAGGTLARSNTGPAGVYIAGSSNTVGGVATGNRIAFNNRGVFVASGTNNPARANSIFANFGLGLSLSPGGGVTPNDAGDPDTGANQLQNFPLVTDAVTNGGGMTIQGTLNSQPLASYTIDFYANTLCDPSGNGEGQLHLGSTGVLTDPSGNVSFSAAIPIGVLPGPFITATATDAANNTSEFSPCFTAVGPSGPISLRVIHTNDVVTISWSNSPAGYQLEYTLTLALPIVWSPITNGIIDDGIFKNFAVSNYFSDPTRFFRLKQP